MKEHIDALVIGAGPAGLMAADVLSDDGHHVVVTDAMLTPARKFLMAGKSGLNLTREEPLNQFVENYRYGDAGSDLPEYLDTSTLAFGPAEVRGWAKSLGVDLFTGSTGRVFPTGMKASPLLRAWLSRLRNAGTEIRTGWRWTGMEAGEFSFLTAAGERRLIPKVTVLALGGASWPRLGSDAAWVPILRNKGVAIADFRPANMGLTVNWSPHMQGFVGAAVKGVAIHAGDNVSRGEWVITRQGIEGGGVYQVASEIRDGCRATIDLVPDLTTEQLNQRFDRSRAKLSVGNWLRRILSDPVKVALLLEWGRSWPTDARAWAAKAKALPLQHNGPMGLDRAISSAGGISRASLTEALELIPLTGLFAAGEMLDWEAPTGGYLLTGCLATGRHAGISASRFLARY